MGEVGAALLLTPNGERVLSHLGFSFSKARGRQMTCWEMLDGTTLEMIARTDLRDSEERFGAPVHTVHRVDLHNELIRLASRKAEGQQDVQLQLGAKVRTADAEEGMVELEDGTKHRADLIVAADGLHSALKSVVLGHEVTVPTSSGLSAFRFQIPTALLEEDPHFIELLKSKGRGSTLLADTEEQKTERHLVWYDCQGYGLLHPYFITSSQY